ncbi:MAG: hypothetical protein HUJ73_03305, partial [Eubacterium sp.]|nr:hypothetical protein [Eubacterium sp.]
KEEEAGHQLTEKKTILERLEKDLTDKTKTMDELSGIFEEVLRENGFKDEEEMLSCYLPEEEIEAEENKLRDYDLEVKSNGDQLKAAEESAKERTWIDIEQLSSQREEQKHIVEQLNASQGIIRGRIENNKETAEKISSREGEWKRYRREYSVCRRLHDMVSGKTGNGKITLEQYVQAAGFDGIIRAANRRLSPMSDGQYELYRKEGELGRQSNTFLDLEVLDNYTGHRRPVGNLSGGESFKASLSLALGLSDTVSTNLGGIQMDALFVDEGFGTLDKKSIESALDILVNLSGANKLVGVISHREELIENIPQQIKVEKGKGGSFITVETEL